MRHVLVTGFEPFGGDTVNPSAWAVQQLDGCVLHTVQGPATVHGCILPCVYGAADGMLHAALTRLNPEVVLATGLAAGRHGLTLERVGINLDDARIPDNAGHQPIDQPIEPGGAAAYFTTLPVKAMVADLQAAGIEAALSHSAGTFLCNHVLYRLLAWQARTGRPRAAGFMHLPWCTGQGPAGEPGMAPEALLRGLRTALTTALERRTDLHVAGGAIC